MDTPLLFTPIGRVVRSLKLEGAVATASRPLVLAGASRFRSRYSHSSGLRFMGCADAENLHETLLSRRSDDHRAAILYPLCPAESEAAIGERRSNRPADVRPAFCPVETGATEVAAPGAGSNDIDPKFREDPAAFLGYLCRLVAKHEVFARNEKIGQVDAETSRQMVVANPGRLKLSCLSR